MKHPNTNTAIANCNRSTTGGSFVVPIVLVVVLACFCGAPSRVPLPQADGVALNFNLVTNATVNTSINNIFHRISFSNNYSARCLFGVSGCFLFLLFSVLFYPSRCCLCFVRRLPHAPLLRSRCVRLVELQLYFSTKLYTTVGHVRMHRVDTDAPSSRNPGRLFVWSFFDWYGSGLFLLFATVAAAG